ncbi:MAG: hypothetical protein AB1921_00630 [Thermodesulfobacteriota bacterium]
MDPILLSLDELKELYGRRMAVSDRAARKNPLGYKRLRCLLCRVKNHPVDVESWTGLATQVARLCEEMGPGTVFEFFSENIHPHKRGQARFFRTECRELLRQCDELTEWRIARSGLRIVK